MTKQMQRVRVETKQEVVTQVQSLTMCKDFIRNSLSCIAYLRNLLPEASFQNDVICDTSIRVLRRGVSRGGDTVLDWLEKGCFDALEKGYLKTIVLGIYTNEHDPTNMVETFSINVEYQNNLPAIEVKSGASKLGKVGPTRRDIHTATVQLLRTLLVLVQTLSPLPELKFLTMKIHYYDDITPASYQPPMFRAGAYKESVFYFNENPTKLRIGEVDSVYHKMSMKVHTLCDKPDEEEEDDDNAMVIDNNEGHRKRSGSPDLAIPEHQKMIENTEVSCPCRDDENGENTVLCESCQTWQHLYCMGYTIEDEINGNIPQQHVCLPCKSGRDVSEFRQLCQVRRSAGIIFEEGYQSVADLARKLNMDRKKCSELCAELASLEILKPLKGVLLGRGRGKKYEFKLDREARASYKVIMTSDRLPQPKTPVLPQQNHARTSKLANAADFTQCTQNTEIMTQQQPRRRKDYEFYVPESQRGLSNEQKAALEKISLANSPIRL